MVQERKRRVDSSEPSVGMVNYVNSQHPYIHLQSSNVATEINEATAPWAMVMVHRNKLCQSLQRIAKFQWWRRNPRSNHF